MEDIDSSPTNTASGGGGAGGDTNWENMKPRDKQGDDIVRKAESMLPKWKGPSGEEGWISLEAKVRPCEVFLWRIEGTETLDRKLTIRILDTEKF